MGVMSHLATADETDESFVMAQYEQFIESLEIIKKYGHRPTYIHL